MKLIFAGTPAFSVHALRALHEAGHDISLVLTQPDRPAGRGMAFKASPVKMLAQSFGMEVFQPVTLKDPSVQERLRAVEADVMVVVAYGLILPLPVLEIPKFGCINIHASLLPRWRGAAPIQRAILAGDRETGVCIMQMETGLDTGPVLLSGAVPINPGETAGMLHDKLALLGAELIVKALHRLSSSDGLPVRPQPSEGITYAEKIQKTEATIDWRQSAVTLLRQICAFNPVPGAVASLHGSPVKIWTAEIVDGSGALGEMITVERNALIVACGEKALRILELQKAGGKRLVTGEFLMGNSLQTGHSFDVKT